MKYLLVIFFAFVLCNMSKGQPACCVKATDDFAALGNIAAFRKEHKAPQRFTYPSSVGKDINYPLQDGSTAHAFEIKSATPTPYYVFVIHEWWGLNDYVKQESEKLANDLGVNVLAIDLYDGKVAAAPDEAVKYMQSVNNTRALQIIDGAYAHAGADAAVFTVGWCFGGGWSLQTALQGGTQAKGCVMYYGMPERDANKLQKLECDVIGFFASKDQRITPAIVKDFEEKMNEAGKEVTIYMYDAAHAFANPSNPVFDKAARDDAYSKQIAFIKARM